MTDIIDDIELDDELSNSPLGRKYLFWYKEYPIDKTFRFTSKIEDIPFPEKRNTVLKNKTEVLILSEPVLSLFPDGMQCQVVKVLAPCLEGMTNIWIPVISLVEIDETSST